MNNNYENKFLDAMQILIDNAVSRAGYDKTIKAVVSKCVDESKGKYVVRYQDSSFYALENNIHVYLQIYFPPLKGEFVQWRVH